MISYFPNEQGDYTITLNDEPIAWVKSESQALSFQRVFSTLDERVDVLKKQNKDLHDEVLTLKHEASKAQQKHDNMKEVMAEMGQRFRAKLMSVYYLLGTIKKMGTHREKEVAVGYLQQTVDDLVKDEGGLSWDQDLFNLPF
jgi:predicted RNase H-like nuclease (RuvC/YqgF family)